MIRNTLTLAALASLPGLIAAQPAVADAVQEAAVVATVEGTVQSVDREGKSFTLKVGERTKTIRIDRGTKYVLDGKEAEMKDVLKPGADVTVVHADGLASRVEAESA